MHPRWCGPDFPKSQNFFFIIRPPSAAKPNYEKPQIQSGPVTTQDSKIMSFGEYSLFGNDCSDMHLRCIIDTSAQLLLQRMSSDSTKDRQTVGMLLMNKRSHYLNAVARASLIQLVNVVYCCFIIPPCDEISQDIFRSCARTQKLYRFVRLALQHAIPVNKIGLPCEVADSQPRIW